MKLGNFHLPVELNSQTRDIKTIVNQEDKSIWFVAKDTALMLGYSNPQKAILDHTRKSRSFGDFVKSNGLRPLKFQETFDNSWQQTKLIPESDVWRLIIKSKMPKAVKIEKWVMEDILPLIRKDGYYISEEAKQNPSKKTNKRI
jgi:prophage antirepressor-like protein